MKVANKYESVRHRYNVCAPLLLCFFSHSFPASKLMKSPLLTTEQPVSVREIHIVNYFSPLFLISLFQKDMGEEWYAKGQRKKHT